MNYTNFEFKQLIICLPKVLKSPVFIKVMNEIKLRIILGDFETSAATDYLILKNAFEFSLSDNLL